MKTKCLALELKDRHMSVMMEGEFGRSNCKNPMGLYHSLEMGRSFEVKEPGAKKMISLYKDIA